MVGYDTLDIRKCLALINDNLPKIDNTSYRIELGSEYDPIKNDYVIYCDTTMMKRFYSTVKVPFSHTKNNDAEKFIWVLIDDLNEKITGTRPERNYVEIDGVKYYPKDDGDN